MKSELVAEKWPTLFLIGATVRQEQTQKMQAKRDLDCSAWDAGTLQLMLLSTKKATRGGLVVILTTLVEEGLRFESQGCRLLHTLPMSALVMASLLYTHHTCDRAACGMNLKLSVSHVLSPPASYIGLACQDRYIALRWINFESYDNLRKISSNLFICYTPNLCNLWSTGRPVLQRLSMQSTMAFKGGDSIQTLGS
jgi:hypothetical protein